MAINNYDLKTVRKVIGTAPTSLGLGAVPANMKRWVTFIRADNEYGGANRLYIVSTVSETYASTLTRASAAAKDRLYLPNGGTKSIPNAGPSNVEVPLFSIDAGKYLTALTDRGNVDLFIQYYEE